MLSRPPEGLRFGKPRIIAVVKGTEPSRGTGRNDHSSYQPIPLRLRARVRTAVVRVTDHARTGLFKVTPGLRQGRMCAAVMSPLLWFNIFLRSGTRTCTGPERLTKNNPRRTGALKKMGG